MSRESAQEQALVSYLTLRRVIGVLGAALPVVLALWGFWLMGEFRLLDSISDYYGLRTRDAFVGVLFALAWFLFTYRGYAPEDDRAGDLACVFALGVALFQNSGATWERVAHYASAAALFVVLSYFSLGLFTRSSGQMTPEKRLRNRIYVAMGVVMLLCVALIPIYHLLLQDSWLSTLKPVFWLEAGALWAFGASWFIKGETLFKDEEPQSAWPRRKSTVPGKDFWDKLDKASTFLASVVLASVTFGVTQVVNARSRARDAILQEAEIRNAQLETVQGFMEHLTGAGAEQDVAILAISMLGNEELAVRLGEAVGRSEALQAMLPNLARVNEHRLIESIVDGGADPDVADAAGLTPLMAAASAGSTEALEVLVRHGANLNALSGRTGWTPLMYAAARGRSAAVTTLVGSGADLGAVNHLGQSALWLAAQAGHEDVVLGLTERGAAVNQSDAEQWSPLFVAASNGHAGVVAILVAHGADSNGRTRDGETPLMGAAEGGHLQVVRSLLRAGADREVTDAQGELAVDRARRFGRTDVVDLLEGRTSR